jgi:Fe-S-cluster containining protein
MAKKYFWASPGSLVKHLATGKIERVGTITPKRVKGRCVFLTEDDRCSIHAVAPFGCAYFDTHMSMEQAHPRSLWLVDSTKREDYQALRDQLPYATSYKPSQY